MQLRRGKWLVILLALGAGAELFARYGLGLGTPPLSVAHPQIEYLLQPNQDLYRFGKHFLTNAYGMRSAAFPKHKAQADELRIMVFGDSVVNGGSLTDHAQLATTLLQQRLQARHRGRVIVGNISAGSWGPQNLLAYARAYGWFDADIVVVVLSSHDYADTPSFAPLDPQTHPTRRPWSAVWEGLTRYGPRYWPGAAPAAQPAPPPAPKAVEQALDGLEAFLRLAQASGASVHVLQHWTQSELEAGAPAVGNRLIRQRCARLGLTPVQLDGAFRTALAAGRQPYRDDIHPNDLGQQLIAEVLYALIGA